MKALHTKCIAIYIRTLWTFPFYLSASLSWCIRGSRAWVRPPSGKAWRRPLPRWPTMARTLCAGSDRWTAPALENWIMIVSVRLSVADKKCELVYKISLLNDKRVGVIKWQCFFLIIPKCLSWFKQDADRNVFGIAICKGINSRADYE